MAENKPKKKSILYIAAGLIIISIFGLSTQFGTNGKIKSSGQTRKYLIYVPESYDPDTKTPLVISIHGFVEWPAHQQSMTGWNKVADENGFLVVYPKGTGFPLRWSTRPSEENPGAMDEELQFFSDLIDHLSKFYNIDPSRIYVNGMSNGGGMSELLACEFSDRITAIGGVAGAYVYPREDCHTARPMPVIAFHGVDDEIVIYQGGASSRDEQFIFPGVEAWAGGWAENNSCSTTPEISKITNEITRRYYTDCEADAEVILYSLEGAGHTWPGGEKLPVWIAGYTNQDINASALMWEFFSSYSLELK
jgi:polyhydroxybutyrate depolymerase